MPHRAARLTETREHLLTAAETLFPARGFEATSVRDLATVAHCSVCEDITESKRAAETLRESEEGFRRMAPKPSLKRYGSWPCNQSRSWYGSPSDERPASVVGGRCSPLL